MIMPSEQLHQQVGPWRGQRSLSTPLSAFGTMTHSKSFERTCLECEFVYMRIASRACTHARCAQNSAWMHMCACMQCIVCWFVCVCTSVVTAQCACYKMHRLVFRQGTCLYTALHSNLGLRCQMHFRNWTCMSNKYRRVMNAISCCDSNHVYTQACRAVNSDKHNFEHLCKHIVLFQQVQLNCRTMVGTIYQQTRLDCT